MLERGHEDTPACSTGNAGMICPSHFIPLAAPGMIGLGLRWMFNPESPFWLRPRPSLDLARWGYLFWKACTPERARRAGPALRDLSLESRRLFVEMAESGIDFGLRQRGLLMLCQSQHALDEEAEVARRARDLGIEAEVLTPGEIAALEPGSPVAARGAIYFPGDCHLDPSRFLAALRSEILRMGGAIHYGCEVAEILATGRRAEAAVAGNGEDFEADEIIIAGGAWSPQIARRLRATLPMQAGKGYSVTLPNARPLPEICSILTEARVAVTPMGGALRVGGTMEIAGIDQSVNPRRVRAILRALPRYYPGFHESDFAGQDVWVGLRPCSPDGLPYIGRLAQYDNITCATGHAMLGLSLGPGTGALVADLICQETPRVATGPFSPDRFARSAH